MLHSENKARRDEIGSARELIQQSHTSTHIFLWGLELSFVRMMISIDILIKEDRAHHIIEQ